MMKICDKLLVKPLIILSQNSIKSSHYPDIWKKSNVIPVYKQNDKQLIQKCRPISLLSIFGKMFEKVVFNRIYNFLLNERLLNPNQSGFRSSYSCVNQSLMKFSNHLIVIHPSKLDQFLQIYPKHSTRFGIINVYFMN